MKFVHPGPKVLLYFTISRLMLFVLLQPSAVETDSEEYRSHNHTESDIEVEKDVIQDLETIQVKHGGFFSWNSFSTEFNLDFKSGGIF